MEESADRLVGEQIEYYRARAGEYDEWFLRRGRYDRGPELKREWFTEVEEVDRALDQFSPVGRVLELACGTGWWTERLARYTDDLTAVDVSPEVLELNRQRLGEGRARYVQADLFHWRPDGAYDVVFFSFWLSHVPPERFAAFWERVRACLASGGRVFFVDSLYNEAGIAVNHRLEGRQATTTTRRLNDGREFRIVKVYYDPSDLERRLADLGWRITARGTANHFLYGWGEPMPSPGG